MRYQYIYEKKGLKSQSQLDVMDDIWKTFDLKQDLERTHFYPITQLYNHWIEKKTEMVGKTNFKMLDSGCGLGRLLRYYSDMNINIFGFELLEGVAAKVKKNFPLLNIFAADIARVPFLNSVFDMYLSVGVLRWVPAEESLNVFTEANRVLKPGGYLILDTHLVRPIKILNGWTDYFYKMVLKKGIYIRKRIGIDYTFRDIKRMCQSADFEIIHLSAERTGYFLYRIQKLSVLRKIFLQPTENTLHPYIYKWRWEKIFAKILMLLRAYGGAVIVVAQKKGNLTTANS